MHERSPLDRYFRAAFAARSRFAEDCLRTAVELRAISRYVILGAGLDTFAYRNPFPGLRVFEVDHPATQAAKRERLAQAGIDVPPSVTFVPIDFSTTRLDDVLQLDGPAFFSWLGVVPYLELAAIRATLRFVVSRAKNSELVFDFGPPPESLSWKARLVFRSMAKRVAAAGEPFKTFFEPDDLMRVMRESGFSTAEDFGPAELNRLYFAGRSDNVRIGEMLHMCRGIV